jgi:hypothetical protein
LILQLAAITYQFVTRKAPVLVLFAALLFQTINKGCIVWSYYINTSAYAKNCINKSKPQLHCNGKCQMMKKLKQEEKKDAQSPERKQGQDEIISSKSFFTTVIPARSSLRFRYPVARCNDLRDMSYDFFHPPGIA